MTVITTQEFEANPSKYYDLVDKGEKVLIKLKNKIAYVLTAVNESDIYFTPEVMERIDESFEQAQRGEVRELEPKDISKYLGL